MKTKLQNLGIRFFVCGLMVMSSLYLIWPDPVVTTAQVKTIASSAAQHSALIAAPTAVPTAAPAAVFASALPSAASIIVPNQAQASSAVATTRVGTPADQAQKTRKILN